MFTFLFWNMGGAAPDGREALLANTLANIANRHQVDVLLLTENPLPQPYLLTVVNAQNPRPFQASTPPSLCERIAVFPRFPPDSLRPISESSHYSIRRLRVPGKVGVLLVVVHLASKLFRSRESQAACLPALGAQIRQAERKAKHQRTVLVGDFNMNPFEDGFAAAEGLNAVMTRETAQRGGRTIDTVYYPFFYNPMRSHFGDSTHEIHPPGSAEHQPAGTCYYPIRESIGYDWNMFDQVLIRPELLSVFRNRDLRILTTDGLTSFLNVRGRPNRQQLSDHLPILFRLDV